MKEKPHHPSQIGAKAAARRRVLWRESVDRSTLAEVRRLTARGLDAGSIAVRMGIRVSTVLHAIEVNCRSKDGNGDGQLGKNPKTP